MGSVRGRNDVDILPRLPTLPRHRKQQRPDAGLFLSRRPMGYEDLQYCGVDRDDTSRTDTMAIIDYFNGRSNTDRDDEPRYSVLAVAACTVGAILVPINCVSLALLAPIESPAPSWVYVVWNT